MGKRCGPVDPRAHVVDPEHPAVHRVGPHRAIAWHHAERTHRRRDRCCDHEPDGEPTPLAVGGQHRQVGGAGHEHADDVPLVRECGLHHDHERGRGNRDDECGARGQAANGSVQGFDDFLIPIVRDRFGRPRRRPPEAGIGGDGLVDRVDRVDQSGHSVKMTGPR